MEQRIFHGAFTAQTLANILITTFNRSNLKAQVIGEDPTMLVQFASREHAHSGGNTALSILLQNVEDGVAIKLGQQSWLGIAASMGFTALLAMRNPFNLLTRIDDLAQDIENLQLQDEVWKTLEENARALGASFDLSDRLRRIACEYCNVANPPGAPTCIACGAPLGNVQPFTCKNCGYVLLKNESVCPNCRKSTR
jgi:hypothetical protein